MCELTFTGWNVLTLIVGAGMAFGFVVWETDQRIAADVKRDRQR